MSPFNIENEPDMDDISKSIEEYRVIQSRSKIHLAYGRLAKPAKGLISTRILKPLVPKISEADTPKFTGDGAFRGEGVYYWIRGRVDNAANVSGHRLSTAEVEASLLESRK
ncbi:hypothetical protein VE03_08820 [Pseudogymnoascus sp. 23342-1-I1]|nr:hypothetical protein VE03_08820 [Pseudogymnoascus sp. 23342-1-I1]